MMTLEGHYFNNAHLPYRNKITILIFNIPPQKIRIQCTLLQLQNNALSHYILIKIKTYSISDLCFLLAQCKRNKFTGTYVMNIFLFCSLLRHEYYNKKVWY